MYQFGLPKANRGDQANGALPKIFWCAQTAGSLACGNQPVAFDPSIFWLNVFSNCDTPLPLDESVLDGKVLTDRFCSSVAVVTSEI